MIDVKTILGCKLNQEELKLLYVHTIVAAYRREAPKGP